MILLHRLTPFLLAASIAAGFGALILPAPRLTWAVILLFVVTPLLLARLLLFEVRRPAFWVFLLVPLFLVASAFFFTLFLEGTRDQIMVAAFVVLPVALYAENLFTFYHLPRAYQAYSLEYLTLVITILGGFFYASGAYAAHIFLPDFVPLWLPVITTFVVVLSLTLAVFWVSKIGFETGRRYALAGAVMLTECFFLIALLPTSFVTNAAAFTALFYGYLGLTRAHVLEKLNAELVRRYVVVGSVLLLLIFLTAQWL